MVYISDFSPNSINQQELPALLDPIAIRSARQIYRAYTQNHGEGTKRPVGVAIDRYTHRGHLIFGQKPVLLPYECFIPLSQLEQD